MRIPIKKFAAYLIISIILALGLSISLQSLLAAWNAPTASPPDDNIPAPLYATSSVPQMINKQGGTGGSLGVEGNFSVGDDSYFAGNVGIGTSLSGAKLDVAGLCPDTVGIKYVKSGCQDARILLGDNTNLWSLAVGWATGGDFSIIEEGVTGDRLYIQQTTGYVGINDSSPDGIFEVNPNGTEDDGDEFVIDASGNVGIGVNPPTEKLDVNGNVQATAFLYSSDEALKKDIHSVSDALDKISQLEGVNFTWKDSGEKSIGLIAQDVEKVFPELVHTDSNTGLKSVEYGNLVAPLIEAIKAQQSQIEKQEQTIIKQQKEIDKLKIKIRKANNE